ncbi:putative IS1341-type transposase [Haloferax mediterranei ATCC 33500]|uniref:IS1341-type transposase n=1 Tax=Haloferax mediterranei (strain ATCC 33500 / DSM 1411 / JCM 8866 / NBRC 14739 / NCIMB 2177 / R-4) TaxID=523841 RepID=I3RAW0_HALMT|nr:putative IS1341-type transposase [Haloferax mediterranei ATCC 33500]ELZ97307.1 putative IS1341-type transposase [Haloferax mediterranei ATCC 33500]
MGTSPRLQGRNPRENTSGDNTAGIDLGIRNYLAIAYDDGDAELYPGNVLKQNKHYFTRDGYDTEGENGRYAVRFASDRNSRVRKTTSCTPSPSTS